MRHDEGHPPLAEVHWEGDSREVLKDFPEDIRGNFGFALYELQLGRRPSIATRRMPPIGEGAYEMKEGDARSWYRLIYLAKIDDVIYVLHCFEKRSRKTSQQDLRVAKMRFSRVRRRIEEQRRNAKRN